MAQINAAISCNGCYRSKRKCDKRMPSCASCERTGKRCDYGNSPFAAPLRGRAAAAARHVDRNQMLNTQKTSSESVFRQDLKAVTGTRGTTRNPKFTSKSRFPALWFLDSMVARGKGIAPPTDLKWEAISGTDVPVPPYAQMRAIVDEFFDTVNYWFPIGENEELLQNPASSH